MQVSADGAARAYLIFFVVVLVVCLRTLAIDISAVGVVRGTTSHGC
jgi:hypothetical protein